jgi:hypothetical protein
VDGDGIADAAYNLPGNSYADFIPLMGGFDSEKSITPVEDLNIGEMGKSTNENEIIPKETENNENESINEEEPVETETTINETEPVETETTINEAEPVEM